MLFKKKETLTTTRSCNNFSSNYTMHIYAPRLLCQKFRFLLLLFHFSSSASSFFFFFNSDTQKKRRQCSQQLTERHSFLLIWKLFKQNREILMFLKVSLYLCTYVNTYIPWCATHIIQHTILPQTLDFDFPNKFPWEEFERNRKRKTFHNNIHTR